MLRTLDADDIGLEGDYSWVHFSLQYDDSAGQKDIFVYGNFNDWQLTQETKMSYNRENGLYEATILFKQGFYNYTYVTVDERNKINPYEIEGSFYQTENNYDVLVYYRKFGDRYDQVIGYGTADSEKLLN